MRSETQAFGYRVVATLMVVITAVNTALDGTLTSAVTGGAAAVAFALLSLSCSIEARKEDAR